MTANRVNPIEVHNTTKKFGGFLAVDDVELQVAPGEVVGLLGANGAGKTTLIKMILGLLAPTAGTVRLFGAPPGIEQRRRIGYVPQNLGLYTDLTVTENLSFRGEVFAAAPTTSDATADRRLVGDLPLGLQRRVAFTAALQHQPELLMLDEPTSGVSPLARSELWDLIRTEADRGVGVLVSTHYMDEAVQADRLAVMARGRLVGGGSVDSVIGDRHTLVVEADEWAEAFAVIEADGRRPLLAGRSIRVPLDPGVDAGRVRRLLDEAGIQAEVRLDRATLEETLVELSG